MVFSEKNIVNLTLDEQRKKEIKDIEKHNKSELLKLLAVTPVAFVALLLANPCRTAKKVKNNGLAGFKNLKEPFKRPVKVIKKVYKDGKDALNSKKEQFEKEDTRFYHLQNIVGLVLDDDYSVLNFMGLTKDGSFEITTRKYCFKDNTKDLEISKDKVFVRLFDSEYAFKINENAYNALLCLFHNSRRR